MTAQKKDKDSIDFSNPKCIRFKAPADVSVYPANDDFTPKGTYDPAQVNWGCVGACTPDEAEQMAKALRLAVEFARADTAAFQADNPHLKPRTR